MKIFKSHYFFYIILSALLVVLGISLLFAEGKIGSDAGTLTITVGYYARWKNPDETRNYGNYINTSGDSIDMSCGSITVSVTINPGSHSDCRVKGNGSQTTTKNSSVIVYGYTSDWVNNAYSITFSGSASPASGFLYSWDNNYNGSTEYGKSPLKDKGKVLGFTCNFSPRSTTINYDVNGGKWSDDTTENKTQSTYYYERYSVPDNPSRTGYTFAGFKTNSSSGESITSSSIFKGDTSIYANWTANTYTITFDKQSGSGGTDSTVATYDSTVPDISTPSKTGHVFKGYYTGTNGSGTQYYNSAGKGQVIYTQTSDITLYAHWEKETYNLKFNANGGSCSTTEATVTFGQNYTFPIPTRVGYRFDNWEYNSSTNYVGSNTIPDFGSNGCTVNLTAKWTLEEYDIVYYPNNSLDTWSDTVNYGASYTLDTPSSKPTQIIKLGYRFTTWMYSNTGPVSTYHGVKYGQPPNNYQITIPDWGNFGEDVPLEAQWIPNEYDIIFDGNDSTSGEMSSQHMIYDTSATLYQNAFQKTGYEFRGWSTEKIEGPAYAEGDEMYIDGQSVVNLTSVHNAQITLYAVWDPIEYTLRYNANNGTDDYFDETLTYDIEYNLKDNEFIYKGYLFTGWSTSENGNVIYLNEIEVKNLTHIKDDVVNIYAVWKETWAVNYKEPSGSGSASDPYLIANAQNLAWISWKLENREGFGNKVTPYFKQTANIDLSEYEWLPIGNQSKPFTGNYDGNGYIIKNVRTFGITNVIRENIGLFGYASKSPTSSTSNYIKNVRIWGDIEGNSNVGGILGYGNSVTIENCTNNCTISATTITDSATSIAGGIAGQIQNAEIISCYNYGDISSSTNDGVSGGIVGQGNSSKILNSYSNCNLDNGYYSGGIAGKMTAGEISSSVFEGTVYGTYSGAISGFLSNVTITNCFVKGQTENKSNKGLYAQSSNTVKFLNCIIDVNGFKGYTGTDFSNWIISSDGRPLPSGLSWLAIGGTKVTDISQISANYTTKF